VAFIILLAPIPALVGFVILALAPAYLSQRETLALGVIAGIMPAVILVPTVALCLATDCGGGLVPIMTIDFEDAVIDLALRLDPLSAVGGATVSLIGAAVLLYSSNYMRGSLTADLRRFFALMNLFMASMLAMVLAGDSITFFLGWEMMGLCSFFLIAYNVRSPRAVAAGRKAFVMTRIADAALLAGLLLMFVEAGTVRIDALIEATIAAGTPRTETIAALLLIGALGKSAQLPFQTWLPSAMAGPTPVSALLHSATMVAAGVFLLARFAPLYEATPGIAAVTAFMGALTALYGALSAVAQADVKRLLAFSSISQIGFMIVALGVGAPAVAMAHFVVHAAFKALLFLAAGDMARSAGGATAVAALRGASRRRPVAFATYAAGAASLAGLPIVTAGWFSKEAILASAWAAGPFGQLLWAMGLTAAVFTGAYAFRPVLVAALPARGGRPSLGSPAVVLPLTLLAVASVAGGALVGPVIDLLSGHEPHPPDLVILLGAGAPLLGAALAFALVLSPTLLRRLGGRNALGGAGRLDARYHRLFVRPFRALVASVADGRFGEDPVGRAPVEAARRIADAAIGLVAPDHVDLGWEGAGRGVGRLWAAARKLQTGRARDYALALAFGAAALLFLAWGASWV